MMLLNVNVKKHIFHESKIQVSVLLHIKKYIWCVTFVSVMSLDVGRCRSVSSCSRSVRIVWISVRVDWWAGWKHGGGSSTKPPSDILLMTTSTPCRPGKERSFSLISLWRCLYPVLLPSQSSVYCCTAGEPGWRGWVIWLNRWEAQLLQSMRKWSELGMTNRERQTRKATFKICKCDFVTAVSSCFYLLVGGGN